MESRQPTVGRIVHFVASNIVITFADGSQGFDIRPMLITAVAEFAGETKQTFVNGIIFRSDMHDRIFKQPLTEVTQISQDDNHTVGTWHWPAHEGNNP